MSLRGLGWWYDRQRRRYWSIYDHALDASANLPRYRMTDEEYRQIMGGRLPVSEPGRALLIPAVCARGFIRVRLTKGHLGWQFGGDPEDAFTVLKRFAKRHEVGHAVNVTFTDFSFGGIADQWLALLSHRGPMADFLDRWRRSRGERPCRSLVTGSTGRRARSARSTTTRTTSSTTTRTTGSRTTR